MKMKNKLEDAVLGFIVGDAFGVPYEFMQRYTFSVHRYMIGNGSHNQPIGTWSDDTSMLLATLDSFSHGKLYPSRVANQFTAWKEGAVHTPHGKVFDIGGRTAKALDHYSRYKEFLLDNDINSNCNGSLMRILPLAFMVEVNDDLIEKISSITHPHEISKTCCKIYVHFIRYILEHPRTKKKDLFTYMEKLSGDILDVDLIKETDDKNISSDGYVVHTLEAVFWAFFNTNSYEDAIIAAVSLGNDTDTIAAITGGIAGLYYGKESIPPYWLNSIARQDMIHYEINHAIKNM